MSFLCRGMSGRTDCHRTRRPSRLEPAPKEPRILYIYIFFPPVFFVHGLNVNSCTRVPPRFFSLSRILPDAPRVVRLQFLRDYGSWVACFYQMNANPLILKKPHKHYKSHQNIPPPHPP